MLNGMTFIITSICRNERSLKKGIDTFPCEVWHFWQSVEMREAQRRALTSSSSSFIDG